MISRRLVSAKCVNCLLSLLALGSLIGFVYASALAGGRVGTGGDWRRIMLAQAQREAANWANSAALNLEVIAEDAQIDRNGVVFKFVTYPDSLKKLGADIIASTHLYEEEAQIPGSEYTTCAWTNDPDSQSLNDIVFSLKLCEGGLFNGGQSFANRLLLHESVHHLLRDQSFRTAIGADFPGSRAEQDRAEDNLCDDVASAIHRAFETVTIEGRTHWRDIPSPLLKAADGSIVSMQARGFHGTVWTGQTGNPKTNERMIVWGGCREGEQTIYACGGNSYFNDGAIYNPQADEWSAVSMEQAPSPRAEASAIWTGNLGAKNLRNQMIIWGGCTNGDGCEMRLNDGGIYDPAKNSWTSILRSSSAPAPRVHHSSVWTGNKLVVWGGHPNNDSSVYMADPLDTGGVYEPLTKTWTNIPLGDPNQPAARGHHTAIWTGDTGNQLSSKKMLIWGGCRLETADACAHPFGDGAFFDPETLKWSKLTTSGPNPTARHNFSAVYAPGQARLYIFGGFDRESNVISEGAFLDLYTLTWFSMAAMTEGRFKHQAVWAGDKMMIFGGKTYNTSTRNYELASSVVAYIPPFNAGQNLGRWIAYKTDEMEMTRLKTIEHSAVWTGRSMIVWGGQIFDRGFTGTGSQFFPGLSTP